MKKRFFILVVFLSCLSFISQGQRYGSCGTSSKSKLYFTPYIGLGGGTYSYDLNNTIIGPAPDSTVYNSSQGGMFTPVVGIHLMYNVGKVNIGGGGEWAGMYGSSETEISTTEHSAYFYKFYARMEFAFYSDSFCDAGIHLQAGISFPNNVVGTTSELGTFALGGLYYNLILDSQSSLLFSADYEYSTFNTTIGNSISEHVFKPIKVSIGYRFWF